MNAKCIQCNARCCRYFAIPLGMPEGAEDIDTARWYLLHEGTCVFIDREGFWWVRVENRCLMLEESPRGPRCRDYRGRPLVCRRFSPKKCDYALGRWDCRRIFRSAAELDDYMRRLPVVNSARRRGGRADSKRRGQRRVRFA
jgi:Fe-S-cluster containining protein